MRSPSLLIIVAIAVAVVLIGAAVAIPDAVAEERDVRDRPGHVELTEITVAPGDVEAETAALVIDAHLRHRGNPSPNTTVVYRAIDDESGMVATVERVEVGTISAEGERNQTQTLTVDREGSYRLEVLVYQDGMRVSSGGKRIAGVGTLTPEFASTSVRFHRFDGDGPPPITFSVEDAGPNRTALVTSTYLTNGGSATEGLRLEVIARQAESNIIADRQSVQLDRIDAGQTVTPEVRLTVPAEYNYYLDAILWKDGVIVGTTRAAANLDPQRRITVNETVEDVGLEVSDFEPDSAPDEGDAEPPRTPEEDTSIQTPGFGIGAALLAIIGGGLLVRGRYHD